MSPAPQKAHGFSLIEVVLALGVATIALVSVVGLLSVAMSTNGASGHDTMLAAMSGQILSGLRAAPFDALGEAEPANPSNRNLTTLKVPPDNSNYYFTIEGMITTDSSIDRGAIYKCVVTKIPDEGTRSPDTGTASTPKPGPYNLVKLQLSFTWPVGAKKPEERTIYAGIARY